MARAGILTEDDRVELIEGEIVHRSPIGSRHAACVNRLTRLFTQRLKDKAIVRVQNPIHLDEHSEPQPDATLLRPDPTFYAAGHPRPEDILLVIEVGESSGEFDRQTKIPLYARAGVAEVWLVDLSAQAIDVHLDPAPEGYRSVRRASCGSPLSPSEVTDLPIPVEEILE